LQIGDAAVIAARADDVVAGEESTETVEATVETIEYRGREFVGTARTATGLELVFHANRTAAPGSPIWLSIDPARALAFAA